MKRTIAQLRSETGPVANFVRTQRKKLGYTQVELAQKIGVGVRFLKELELGKKTLKMDKINQVLNYFGYELQPVPQKRLSPFEEHLSNDT